MPTKVMYRDEKHKRQLVICHHDERPPEGICPGCGMFVFTNCPAGPTKFWEPMPGLAQLHAERIANEN